MMNNIDLKHIDFVEKDIDKDLLSSLTNDTAIILERISLFVTNALYIPWIYLHFKTLNDEKITYATRVEEVSALGEIIQVVYDYFSNGKVIHRNEIEKTIEGILYSTMRKHYMKQNQAGGT